MVDRYGVTRKGEQYAGWKALPSTTDPTMTTETAAVLIAKAGSEAGFTAAAILEVEGCARAAVRAALRKSHPDTGGSAAEFHLVQTARKVLTAHFGLSL
jgi:hypothetical protein